MSKLGNILFVQLLTFSSIVYAQKLASQEIIGFWKKSDSEQTVFANKVYSDLKNNYTPERYREITTEIKTYIANNNDDRLKVRYYLYEIFYNEMVGKPISQELKNKISDFFKYALTINDEQLLAELYVAFTQSGFGSMEDNLFYLQKGIELMEKIGTQHFPLYYLRLFTLSNYYYELNMFEDCIATSKKSQISLQSAKNNLKIFILNLDLLGASFNELNQPDSSIYYYTKIQENLADYNTNYKNYKNNFNKYDSDFFMIWMGISEGRIGQGLAQKGQLDDGIPMINFNIEQSKKYQLTNDVSRAQTALATVYESKNNIKKAISLYQKAFDNATTSSSKKDIIKSAAGLERIYNKQKRYDSAYFYSKIVEFNEQLVRTSITNSKFLTVSNRLKNDNLAAQVSQAKVIINKQILQRNLILGSLLLFASTLWLMYSNYKKKQKRQLEHATSQFEIAELKYKLSQEEIKEANEELKKFRQKLLDNNELIEKLKSTVEIPNAKYSDLQSVTILTQDDWRNFKLQFNKVYPDYIYTICELFPQLTSAEIRYLCLVKLNLKQNEIASALGVSDSSVRVTWHRMRKKLNIESAISPIDFLKKFELSQKI